MAIGDKVSVKLTGEDCLITEIHPRSTKLSRKRFDSSQKFKGGSEHIIAVNIDIVVIVVSAKNPAFHPRLIDRYIVICQDSGIRPVICVNKVDLVSQPPNLSNYAELGIKFVFLSAKTGENVFKLRDILLNKISVFVGHSGVGKSTLMNQILRSEDIAIGEVRKKDGRGRHTTTNSKLYEFAKNSFVIDTPGIRSLGFWNIDKENLKHYFPEFQDFQDFCRYRNCSHTHEPNCAVKLAVEENKIPKARYDSYVRMYENR